MNPLANDWPIKHRADACARTQRAFEPGEQFYTLLFREGEGFRREDLSEEAWAQRNENIRPFSFWKTRYEPPPPAPPEPLAKENAEDILRRLLAENDPAPRERMLCSGCDVGAQARAETKSRRIEPTTVGFDLRTREDRRRLHCAETFASGWMRSSTSSRKSRSF